MYKSAIKQLDSTQRSGFAFVCDCAGAFKSSLQENLDNNVPAINSDLYMCVFKSNLFKSEVY